MRQYTAHIPDSLLQSTTISKAREINRNDKLPKEDKMPEHYFAEALGISGSTTDTDPDSLSPFQWNQMLATNIAGANRLILKLLDCRAKS